LELCDQIEKAIEGGKLDLTSSLAMQVRIWAAEVDEANPDYGVACTKAADALVSQLFRGDLGRAEVALARGTSDDSVSRQ